MPVLRRTSVLLALDSRDLGTMKVQTNFSTSCKENGPLAHLLWILVFDNQHNQIGLMSLQVFVL